MIGRQWVLIPLILGASLAVPGEGVAQRGSLHPAETVRVVERSDRWDGGVVREVVDDLQPAEVLLVQWALDDAGFGVGAFTAALDGATRGALRRFQIDRGLSICGCVSYETVVALGIVPRVVAGGTYASRDRHRVLVVVPDRRHRDRDHRHGYPVVVGGSGNPGVAVGHRPARGSGRDRVDHRPSRPRPDDSVGPRYPVPPRSGERIRPGDRFGGQDRSGDEGNGSDRPSRPRPR